MKIYVSGPMAGYKQSNIPEFMRVAESLRAAGHKVLNPPEICSELEERSIAGEVIAFQEFLYPDIEEICKFRPDAIVLLDGWRQSRGAGIEHHLLEGMNCITIPLERIHWFL